MLKIGFISKIDLLPNYSKLGTTGGKSVRVKNE
jgi:hypothetical protein